MLANWVTISSTIAGSCIPNPQTGYRLSRNPAWAVFADFLGALMLADGLTEPSRRIFQYVGPHSRRRMVSFDSGLLLRF